jgi:hypothetical protein
MEMEGSPMRKTLVATLIATVLWLAATVPALADPWPPGLVGH